jgi:2-keto-3-deoxy-6-phosphogluconate aldolase
MKLATAREWLSIPSMLCVGGGWFLQGGAKDIAEHARPGAAVRIWVG